MVSGGGLLLGVGDGLAVAEADARDQLTEAGETVSAMAHRNGVSPNLPLFRWRPP